MSECSYHGATSRSIFTLSKRIKIAFLFGITIMKLYYSWSEDFVKISGNLVVEA